MHADLAALFTDLVCTHLCAIGAKGKPAVGPALSLHETEAWNRYWWARRRPRWAKRDASFGGCGPPYPLRQAPWQGFAQGPAVVFTILSLKCEEQVRVSEGLT
jgi:hypothetical protein